MDGNEKIKGLIMMTAFARGSWKHEQNADWMKIGSTDDAAQK